MKLMGIEFNVFIKIVCVFSLWGIFLIKIEFSFKVLNNNYIFRIYFFILILSINLIKVKIFFVYLIKNEVNYIFLIFICFSNLSCLNLLYLYSVGVRKC